MKCKCIKEFNALECESYSIAWEIMEVGQVFHIVEGYENDDFYVLDDKRGNEIQVDEDQFKEYFIML